MIEKYLHTSSKKNTIVFFVWNQRSFSFVLGKFIMSFPWTLVKNTRIWQIHKTFEHDSSVILRAIESFQSWWSWTEPRKSLKLKKKSKPRIPKSLFFGCLYIVTPAFKSWQYKCHNVKQLECGRQSEERGTWSTGLWWTIQP